MSSVALFETAIAEIDALEDGGQRFGLLHCAIRSVLQWTALASSEAAAALVPDVADTRLPEIARQLVVPVDGLLGPAIDHSLTQLSLAGISQPLESWLVDRDGPGSSAARSAQAWAQYRNDSLGHGVVGAEEIDRGLPLLRDWFDCILDGCRHALPERTDDGMLLRLTEQASKRVHVIPIPMLGSVSGRPTVIRRLQLRGDTWQVQGQELEPAAAAPFVYGVSQGSALLSALQLTSARFRAHQLPGATSSTMVLLPQRQTDVFTGRKAELERVQAWLGDLESRVCNVYGEGGIGKTTLVLEALHQVLDGTVSLDPLDLDLVCFYSSKLTRYGPDGVEKIAGITPSIADAAREVARSYHDQLDRDWFGKPPDKLIEKAGQLLRELGIPRDRVLVVLDNTETLMTSAADRDALGAAVDLMARKVGRVLITSRNREKVEARPVALGPLPESEAEQLLLRLAQEEKAEALLQTGTSGRKRIVTKFKGKPLLIEVFARMVARERLSLRKAEEVVLQRAEADLGQFLFEDAWERFTTVQRKVMVTLAQVDTVIPSTGIGVACSSMGCSHPEMFETLEENRFAQIQNYGATYDIVFDSIAMGFLRGKFDSLNSDEAAEVRQAISKVQQGLREARPLEMGSPEDIPGPEIADEVVSDAARAAWIATKRGDLIEARTLYEEALELEPDSAVVHHRYAFFLTRHMGDLYAAARHAARACELDPNDGEAWFTLANISARQGGVGVVDDAVARAMRAGFKEVHRCALLQARARVTAIHGRHPRSSVYEQEARQFLDASRIRPRSRLDERHMEEVDKVSRRLDEAGPS